MSTPTQLDHDLFRVLLYRKDAAELLLEARPNGLRVPTVAIPSHTRIAQQITAAIKSSWDLDTCCLFPLPCTESSASPLCYQVLEIRPPKSEPPAGMRWLPIDTALTAVSEDDADFGAVQDSLKKIAQYRLGELPGPFARPGWLEKVTEWVRSQAANAHLSLTGEIRQLNASPTFSLIRFETDGSALWFKAVGEPNVHEYPITLKLASSFPEFMPRILGTRPEWNAWLALEAAGSELDATSPARAWEVAAENLAQLQMASLGRRFELIEAGCKDLRPCSLIDLVDPFFNFMGELMERQVIASPCPLSGDELLPLARDVRSALAEFGDAIPNTIGHFDIGPRNILVSEPNCTFIDWAEAFIGPAFFTFQYLLEHWKRQHKIDSIQERSFTSSYVRHWNRWASSNEIARLLSALPLLTAFAFASGSSVWRNPETMCPKTAGHLRSIVRRMKREAETLRKRGLACAP